MHDRHLGRPLGVCLVHSGFIVNYIESKIKRGQGESIVLSNQTAGYQLSAGGTII